MNPHDIMPIVLSLNDKPLSEIPPMPRTNLSSGWIARKIRRRPIKAKRTTAAWPA